MIYNITPVAKPRMTRSDKWKKRPCVMRYWEFCDKVQGNNIRIKSGDRIIFHVPMPKSWSKRKRDEMNGSPHKQNYTFIKLESLYMYFFCLVFHSISIAPS